MELRHVRYFVVLAEELNFSRAAKKLHISQPPLSRQIQELEAELGARLFTRTNRHVELTNAGKVFLKKAYQILDQVEQAYMSTRLSTTGSEGEFRIGFTSTVQDLIPGLQKYRERYPKVGIVLYQMNSNDQIEALLEKKIDVGLVTTPVNNTKIEVFPFKKVEFMAALPDKHPLATKPSIYIRDLADETFIITPKSAGPLYYDLFMSAFEKANFTPNITIQANNLQIVLALVAGGMGITLFPSTSQDLSGVIKRKVEDIDLAIQSYIVWRKDDHSEILKKYQQFL